MENIVVFGKAHSGKSTLIGYILSRQNKSFAAEDRKLRAELGENYEPSYMYSYIVDDSKYEQNNASKKPGTRNLHIRKTSLPTGQQVTLIDTPGFDNLKRPKAKGAFFADIGVFCLEMHDVTSDDFLANFAEHSSVMSSLMLWSYFDRKRIIVALTKADLSNYSEEEFEAAKEKVYAICNAAHIESILVIPTVVLVDERIDHNVVEKSDLLSWFDGPTLCEAISREIQNCSNERGDELLFCIDRQVAHPKLQTGKIWTIKIIQGKLSLNDDIILSPVLTIDRKFVDISARVKKIRYDVHKTEEYEEIQTAYPGSIVGIDLRDVYANGRKISKKDFNTLYTTCGFHKDVRFIVSSMLRFAVSSEHKEEFTARRQFSLIWFGRGITFSVLKSYEDTADRMIVEAKITPRKITLPINAEGNYYFTSLLIKDENGEFDNQYYDAELIGLIEEGE